MQIHRWMLFIAAIQDLSSAQDVKYIELRDDVIELNKTLNGIQRKIEALGDVQMKVETCEGITTKNKDALLRLAQEIGQLVRQNELEEFRQILRAELHQELEHVKGAAVNNQDCLQRCEGIQQKQDDMVDKLDALHQELEHVNGTAVNNQDSLRRCEGIQEKQDEIEDKLKGYEEIKQKQDDIVDKLKELHQELEDVKGTAVNNQDSLQRYEGIWQKQDDIADKLEELHQELEHVKGAAVDKKDSLQSSLQEIKSFVHEEISRIISLSETDECSDGSHTCGIDSICKNTLFSFTCSCSPGFTWDGSDCADIDECVQGKADCSNQAICKNTLGSFSCSCKPTFEGDGRTCSCPPGFELKDNICEDIDECVQGKADCSNQAICKNTLGSFSCSCKPTFEGDGRTCSCPLGFELKDNICEEFQCKEPANAIKGLGCISQVWGRKTFSAMSDFCQDEGGRLLQDFKKHHLADILSKFYPGWVGVYDKKWTSDGSLVPEDLWVGGFRTNPSRRCGILVFNSTSAHKLATENCSQRHRGLCQFPLP